MVKRLIRQAINRLGFEVIKKTRPNEQRVQDYLSGDRRPWTGEYLAYKKHFIREVLEQSDIVRRMQANDTLPEGFGIGIDERCVEYPWVFAHARPQAARVLDAGSALNHDYLLGMEFWQGKQLTVSTLAPETQCHWRQGISYQFADLCDLPFKDAFFDEVICISTLEHVGMDNSFYLKQNPDSRTDPARYLSALAELKRVLKPGGQILLTVPFGKYANHQMFQQFDAEMLERVMDATKPATSKLDVFAYSADGWQRSDVQSCKDHEYSHYALARKQQNGQQLEMDDDNAAAARAVACLLLEKE